MRTDDKALFDLNPHEQSAAAIREIMEVLLHGIRDIELQLGTKCKTDTAGNRLSPADYQKWRSNAIKAMNYRVELYRKYKALRNESTATKGPDDTAQASSGCGEYCEARA